MLVVELGGDRDDAPKQVRGEPQVLGFNLPLNVMLPQRVGSNTTKVFEPSKGSSTEAFQIKEIQGLGSTYPDFMSQLSDP